MFRTCCIGRNERQVDIGRKDRRQFNLGFFCSFFQTLFCHFILREVNTGLALEFADHPVHDFIIKVIAAEVCIPVCSFYFEYAIAQFKDRYIECTTAKVEYENLAVAAFIQAISEGCSRRFIDDTKYVEAGDFTSIFRSLTLGIIEICRNGNDSLGDFFTEVAFRIFLQFLQDHGRDFLGCIFLALDIDSIVFAHVTFNGRNRVFRVGNSLAFCQLANETFTGLGEANDRRCQSGTFCIRDNGRFAAFHNSYNRVCRT